MDSPYGMVGVKHSFTQLCQVDSWSTNLFNKTLGSGVGQDHEVLGHVNIWKIGFRRKK